MYHVWMGVVAFAIVLAFAGEPTSPGVNATLDGYVRRREERLAAMTMPVLPAGEVPGGNEVDRFIAAALPAGEAFPERCDDATFLRRAYLDVVGYGPTLEEAKGFLGSADPGRRAALIDALLARREEYADHWTPFWEDALGSFPGTTNGGMATHGNYTLWIRSAFEENRPFDLFVAELLDPSLPGHKAPEFGYDNGAKRRVHYVLNESHTDTLQTAANVGQVFLGTAMKCASCHSHFENKDWPQARFIGFAGLFAESDLEVIRCEMRSGNFVPPAFPFEVAGHVPSTAASADERVASLAAWLVDPANPRFARSIVNRVWKRYMGVGLVEPADDIREPIESSHPELLDFLADDLARHGFDLKRTTSLILNSRTYQARYDGSLEDGADAGTARRFRSPQLRRLSAEQLIDSVRRAVGQALVRDQRAYAAGTSTLSRALGKPAIRNEISTARSDNPGVVQGLELLNGVELEKLLAGPLVEQAVAQKPGQAVDTLYLAALSRPASAKEREVAAAYLAGEGAAAVTTDPERCRDLLWSLVLSPEFQYIR